LELGPLTVSAIELINKKGNLAVTDACQLILENKYPGIISEALKYYTEEIFPRVLPIFPALINISCALANGELHKTRQLAASMLLITASGDIHDDIIDRSTSKFGKKTLFGKYGKDVTLLTGDFLLTQGMSLIQASEKLNSSQKRVIADSIAESMFELAEAEAVETRLWKKDKVTPEEYFEVIKGKASVAELHCRIGGIIGCADDRTLNQITEYGRLIGLLATLKDEFVDIYSLSEFKSRIKNEMPPYPVLCALENESLRTQLIPLLRGKLSRRSQLAIAKIVMESPSVKQLKINMRQVGEDHLARNGLLNGSKMGKEAAILLKALAIEL
jgi:geranylgeranyl pyrophosphate synthase